MNLGEATRQFQATMEALRTALEHNMDDDELIQASQDAERQLEVAWLQHTTS